MTLKPKLLLLFDAHALLHRAYHAIPPLTSPSGEPTNATFGFASTVLKVWQEFEPDCVAMAFDVGKTFRHEQYAEYKAHRAAPPDDLIAQFDRARDVAQCLGIPDYSVEGFEADDVLATLADQAVEHGLSVIIVTGDSDVLQVVREGVRVYMLGRRVSEGTLYDERAVEERYGLKPAQLIDYKGMAGDSSDNIPGVKGVGVKTASRLLQKYGTIEGIYAHLDEVATRWRNKLEADREMAFQSRDLVQLVHDVDVKLDLQTCSVRTYDRDEAMELFRELGFYRLVDRLPGAPQVVDGQLSLFGDESQEAPSGPEADYVVVDTVKGLSALAERLTQAGAFAFDTETTGIDPIAADLVGISVADEPEQGYYVPIAHAEGSNVALERVKEVLGPVFADPAIKKYAHNADYDIAVLAEHGMPVSGLDFDTMIAAFVATPERRSLGLKQLSWERFGIEMTPITALIGSGRSQKTMDQVSVAKAAPYAAADADMTLRLVPLLRKDLADREQTDLYRDVELPLIPVLVEMERHGVALDVDYLNEMAAELGTRLQQLEDNIYQIAGQRFNINSTKQLGDVLFEQLGLPAPKRTKTGYSTDASVMEALRGEHAIIEDLIEYRQLSKIKSTYVDALPELVNPKTGRVHTSYRQTGAITGRLSSTNPNLQNIPIRSEVGREVRRAFVAAPGCWLLEADYSQVELRVLAHISDDKNLKEAFWRGEDIHASTAAAILDIPLQEVSYNQRRIAKSINFGIIYGMSGYGLARRTDLSIDEANQFITQYFDRYPGVQRYLDDTKKMAREQGYVETLLGRRRYFPELANGSRANRRVQGSAERMAINMPIQGTAADIIKLAMIRMAQAIHARDLKTKMILQVHDELGFEVPEDELELMQGLLRQVMEQIYPLAVPLKVDMERGRDWYNMAEVAA